MKRSVLFLLYGIFWCWFSAANEPCPHFLSENGIGICQEPQTVIADAKDPVRAMTKHITKVTAWRLPMASGKKPLWQKDIPSAPGELYSKPPTGLSLLCMQKPSIGVYPGSRYYDLEHGQFLMASTIAPAITKGYLAGIEIWASFLQPHDYTAPDPLVARISYATSSHPLAIVGLHGSIVKAPFDVFHPAITFTAQRISVIFPGKSGGQTGNIEIPVKDAVLDLKHAAVPVGYHLVPIDLKSNGEDFAYDDAPDKEALGKALTLRSLRITDADHKPLLAKIGEFKNLAVLEIHCLKDLQAIPEQVGELKHLKTLNIDNGNGCVMNPQLPESIGQLSELRTLILYGAQDGSPFGTDKSKSHPIKRTLPKSLANLPNLEVLNLGRNGYGTVPDVVATIHSLKTLDISFNDLSDLPESLARMPNLSKVILDGNYTITCSKAKQADLVRRFPRITFDFQNEYDCSDAPEK